MPRRSRVAVVSISVVAVAVGLAATIGRADQGPQPPIPIAYAPIQIAPTSSVPAVLALGDAMRRLGGSAVVSARIGTPPAGSERVGQPWLYATVAVTDMADGGDVEPMWEADLLEGAVVERSGTSTDVHAEFGGATFDALLPNGTTLADNSGGLGNIVRGQVFGGSRNAQVALRASVLSAGLVPTDVRLLNGIGQAPAIIATAINPRAAMRRFNATVKSVFGSPPRFEGYYIELRDLRGNPFVRASASFRTGAGRVWVDPSMADLDGAPQTLGSPAYSGENRPNAGQVTG